MRANTEFWIDFDRTFPLTKRWYLVGNQKYGPEAQEENQS